MAIFKENSQNDIYDTHNLMLGVNGSVESALDELFDGFRITKDELKSYQREYDMAFDAIADIVFDLLYDRQNRRWKRRDESKKRKVRESVENDDFDEVADDIDNIMDAIYRAVDGIGFDTLVMSDMGIMHIESRNNDRIYRIKIQEE